MLIENKLLLKQAIDDTDILSMKQKLVLKIICESDYPVYLTLKALLDR